MGQIKRLSKALQLVALLPAIFPVIFLPVLMKRLDQVAIAEKTGSVCDRRVSRTTTSNKDSEMIDAEDARI